MPPQKLTESDKQQILELYRLPGETTTTLADRYGVSNSTISRILKTSFSEAEYDALIQQKRSARFAVESAGMDEPIPVGDAPVIDLPSGDAPVIDVPVRDVPAIDISVEEQLAEPPTAQLEMPLVAPEQAPAKVGRRSRKRSSAPEAPIQTPDLVEAPIVEAAPAVATEAIKPVIAPPIVKASKASEDSYHSENAYDSDPSVFKEILREELLAQEDLSELDDDDDDDDLEDDEFDDDGEEAGLSGASLLLGSGEGKLLVQVLPLTDAPLPRTCYLVVDRSAELVARPLKEFGDLGQIPEAEVLENTLPVFDNHRVAKRFSNPRTQRVIKLPDSRVLQKTSSHLQAKGITRLLIDGRVYSLV